MFLAEIQKSLAFFRCQVVRADDDFSDGLLFMDMFKVAQCSKHAEPIAVAVAETMVAVDEADDVFPSCTVDVNGDGVDVHADKLKESLKERCIIAPAHLRYQSAAAVAVRAAEMLAQGIKATPAEDSAPEYLRRSQAEREREERLAAEG